MNILILGGDGFIGSYLRKKHLELGDTVTIIDKECIRSDLNSKEYNFRHYYIEEYGFNTFEFDLSLIKPDLAYNCIAIATPHYYVLEPIKTFDLDFKINYDIINILHRHKIPFIHFSTCEVYGKKYTRPYEEDATDSIFGPAIKSRWIYATSKLLLDQLLCANQGEHVTIRPFNFIEHDIDWLPDLNKCDKYWRPRLPSCFLNSLLTNTPFNIVLPGTQRRCYTHIDDAINAITLIVANWDKCKNEIINIGNPKNEISVIEAAISMLDKYNELCETTKEFKFNSVYGQDYYGQGYEDCERRIPDISKINRLTKWYPRINLNSAFELTIKHALEKYK